MSDVLDLVRERCAEVARRARFVRIDEPGLDALAARLAQDPPGPTSLDPARHHLGDEDTTLAYVVTLDALNFGSGWFPHLAKRDGLSGYFTIATGLKERFDARGPWSPDELLAVTPRECAEVFGQDLAVPEVAELMGLFARALADLGRFLQSRYDGRYAGPVEAAGHSAARLVEILGEMPFYRDVWPYEELEVPLYKRAQITSSDLAAAFSGEGLGRFDDLDRLTIFADNLVPHVLRCEGALAYDAELLARIDAGLLLPPGAPEEVEIRAVALHAVERLVGALRAAGARATASDLDHALWNRGQRPEFKARPRHRTRSTSY